MQKVNLRVSLYGNSLCDSLREKCPNTEFFSGPYFPVFELNTEKYGPQKTPYLDTFQAAIVQTVKVFVAIVTDLKYYHTKPL